MFSLINYFKIILGINKGKSLCRIFQNIECEKIKVNGKIIEFGAEPDSSSNFSDIVKKNSVKLIHYSDKYLKNKKIINADLNKKTNIKKNFYNFVLLFNVMEHLTNILNAKKELKKIMKKEGILIGSTPFLYRFHGAPSDYLRFTKPFLEEFFKKDFKIIKVSNLGFGPFCLCYSFLSDFTKKIPFLNLIIFTVAYIFDFILSLLVKYELKDIYPIAVFFKLKK